MQKINKTFIITEVGSNYNNDLETAKKYIEISKKIGADAVKFQSFKKEKLISPYYYTKGKKFDNLAFSSFNGPELSEEMHYFLKDHSDKVGIEFMSTPFDLEAVDLLEKIGVKRYKIASGDITFIPLLNSINKTNKPVIMSTGASDNNDIEKALNFFTNKENLSLMHCVSSYPPMWNQMNLRAIISLKEDFKVKVGISDHTPGDIVPIASVALGATLIEKHITFDRNLEGPDHAFAMLPTEFESLIQNIRNLEISLGDGVKKPMFDEKDRQKKIRRGIYNPVNFTPEESEGIWLRPEYD